MEIVIPRGTEIIINGFGVITNTPLPVVPANEPEINDARCEWIEFGGTSSKAERCALKAGHQGEHKSHVTSSCRVTIECFHTDAEEKCLLPDTHVGPHVHYCEFEKRYATSL